MELNFSHTGSLIPWKVKHKLALCEPQNRKLLSITEPESEISYAYKKHADLISVNFLEK